MPFTLRNLKNDLEDIGPVFDGAPDLEFRAATKPLQARAVGPDLSARAARCPLPLRPHARDAGRGVRRGERRRPDEARRRGRRPPAWDAVRVPPGTWRGYEAGPEGLEMLVIGAPNLGDDPRGDVDGQRDWWVGD